MPIQSRIRRTVPADIQTVWRTVTSLTDYAWRSDVQTIEPLGAAWFCECSTSGIRTLFTVIQSQPPHLWAFDMENELFSGSWVGRFTALGQGRTGLDFTESVTLKQWRPRWLVRLYLRRQQRRYCRDLCRKLQQTLPETEKAT
ncbi:polyketide cyclase [Eikenella longinqua]|uniref:Polyketide cyclase n=1 Tax=Eikenella longinqua TaxID=1795827 RepID=A0A1A9RVV1_9NEIS|nr:SRPBCC family protein [Eikenella longinqua]OAM26449.1 polyketide cyclase [Eikenella longinqua]